MGPVKGLLASSRSETGLPSGIPAVLRRPALPLLATSTAAHLAQPSLHPRRTLPLLAAILVWEEVRWAQGVCGSAVAC